MSWVILEIMGRQVIAGQLVGATDEDLIRVIIPATTRQPQICQDYGRTSIFRVTYVSQKAAQAAAEDIGYDPLDTLPKPYTRELITREDHDQAIANLTAEIDRLKAIMIMAGEHDDGDDDLDDDFDPELPF